MIKVSIPNGSGSLFFCRVTGKKSLINKGLGDLAKKNSVGVGA
jgi:hypothetical protein